MENVVSSVHDYTSRKDQIVISLGVSRWWLSIIEISDAGYERKELALIGFIPGSAYHRVNCVPLNQWFDSSCGHDELAINLLDSNDEHYHLLDGACEGQIIAEAIGRAMSYVNSVRK